MRPARMRISVLLPQPDGPSAAISSRSFTESETFSSTRTTPPDGWPKSLLMPCRSQRTSTSPPQRVAALGQRVEALPEEPVDEHHQPGHRQDAGRQYREVALLGGDADQRAEAGGAARLSRGGDVLGDDARVP